MYVVIKIVLGHLSPCLSIMHRQMKYFTSPTRWRHHIISSWWRLWVLSYALLILVEVSISSHGRQDGHSSNVRVLAVDQSRLDMGEARLRELEGKAEHSPCWREAVKGLNASCKLLSDIQQSRLAVAFANCHLDKSGRQTYPCTGDMTIAECTNGMDTDAFQSYTHFFMHTGHICYFLQIEVWQGRTEGLIDRLSDTSSEAVEKLERSLDYHRLMDQKQDSALQNQDLILEQDRQIAGSLRDTRQSMESSFTDMTTMAENQKALLGEMFGSLQALVEAVRGLMSLMLVEFIGWETVVVFVVSWLVVMLLPQFHHSRAKMVALLVAEAMVEVCVRRVYGYVVLAGGTPPKNLTGLHSWLWACRYVCAALLVFVYVWEWYNFLDYGERNYRLLEEIRRLLRAQRGAVRPDGPSNDLITKGDSLRRAPIALPDVPHRTTQPVAPGYDLYTSQPPLNYDAPDTPDHDTHTPSHPHISTASHPHTSTTSHPHYADAVFSSDEEYPVT